MRHQNYIRTPALSRIVRSPLIVGSRVDEVVYYRSDHLRWNLGRLTTTLVGVSRDVLLITVTTLLSLTLILSKR